MIGDPLDTLEWSWRIEQGERESIAIPVLDADNEPFSIAGWTVDAKVKDRPGGSTLYTWPSNLITISSDGTTLTLTVPGPVSRLWTWSTGYWRVVISDPTSDVNDPSTHRIISGPFIVDLD